MSDLGFALIHGAGLGGWIWEEVAPAVAYPCVSADFPHRDGDPSTRKGLGLSDYVAEVERQVAGLTAERVVVVAHSIGGVVGLRLAERLGERLAGFVGVAAAIPSGGGSFLSALPPAKGVPDTRRHRHRRHPPAGLGDPRRPLQRPQRRARGRGRPQVRPGIAAAIRRAGGCRPAGRAADVVRLTQDQEFGLDLQTAMARNLGTENVREVDSGHLPMIAQPGEVAAVLNEFGASMR